MNFIIEPNYETYRRWFERSLDLIWKIPADLRSKADPMTEVSKWEKVSKSKAIKSLSAGIKDTIAMTDRYSETDIEILDDKFTSESLPSLTLVRAIVLSKMEKIMNRGRIKSDEEFYALKSLEDCNLSYDRKEEVRRLLSTYEVKRFG